MDKDRKYFDLGSLPEILAMEEKESIIHQLWEKGIKPPEQIGTHPDTGAHYRYEFCGLKLDPFRVAAIYGIDNHCQFSILKKVLCTGMRGKKDLLEDINDIITACERWKEMIAEDEALAERQWTPEV